MWKCTYLFQVRLYFKKQRLKLTGFKQYKKCIYIFSKYLEYVLQSCMEILLHHSWCVALILRIQDADFHILGIKTEQR